MPELPEVQTIVDELKAEIVGKVVDMVDVRLPKMFQGGVKEIQGQKIMNVERRAKLIVLRLSMTNLAIHLKMTGQLFFIPVGKDQTVTGEKERSYTHVIFHFTDGSRLLFNDFRQFGYVKVLSNERLAAILDEYGIEPLDPAFTKQKFTEILDTHKGMRLKALLTDQSIIGGIGNIYVDEALWEAKLHPLTKAGSLTSEQTKDLHKAIIHVLQSALEYKGSSMDMYRRTTGEKGEYDKHREVYRRDGTACPRCGTTIVRMVVGGRGTHICPKEQVQQ